VQADRLAAHRRRIHLRALAARGWRKTPSEAARAASSAVLAAVRRGGRALVVTGIGAPTAHALFRRRWPRATSVIALAQ
jgi:hypothetical protein